MPRLVNCWQCELVSHLNEGLVVVHQECGMEKAQMTSSYQFSSHLVHWLFRNYFSSLNHLFIMLIVWRYVTIIWLSKTWKASSEVDVVPSVLHQFFLENIIPDCLYFVTKSKNLFSCYEAGFLKDESCEDEITCIIQRTADGFQQHSVEHSVPLFLDFSKENQYHFIYNTIWWENENLFLHLLDAGIFWLYTFLSDCRAFVKLFNVNSSSCCLNQGLPQCYSTLSALPIHYLAMLS